MMPQSQVFAHLLDQVRAAHAGHPDLRAFCPFPDDLIPQAVQSFHAPCADYLAQETQLHTHQYAPLRDAFVAAGPFAKWRETYKHTNIGDDFMARFGCYCLVGDGGAFASQKVWIWVVTMPAHLHYTWHHHPGEEIYCVIAGEATFFREGKPEVTLGPGGAVQHAANEPHAMETRDKPVMAMVFWRNGFDTPPVLTERPIT